MQQPHLLEAGGVLGLLRLGILCTSAKQLRSTLIDFLKMRLGSDGMEVLAVWSAWAKASVGGTTAEEEASEPDPESGDWSGWTSLMSTP